MAKEIRYAVWSAVSSEKQAAADKVSLSEQVKIAHQRAQGKGWQSAGFEYVVPGESRTRYVNLRDAEGEIPQLQQMLDDAQAGKFNLLVLYDYNRLRDLIDPVAKTLAAYGVQLYSCNQPVEPTAPEEFTAYANDSESIMRGVAQIVSRSQISDLQRKYAAAMPARVREKGLPMRAPYGYKKGRVDAPPEVDPHTSQACIIAKDMALAGKSLRQICDALHEQGYRSSKGTLFAPKVIREILSNPFYAGQVFFRRSQSVIDPRTGKRTIRMSPPGRMVIAEGKHTPLWTVEEHEALVREMSKRERTYRGSSASLFSGLLECGECGKRVARAFAKNRTYEQDGKTVMRPQEEGFYRCRGGCLKIPHPEMVEIFIVELYRAIKESEQGALAEIDAQAELAEALEQRERLNQAYLAKAYELNEYLALKQSVDERVADLQGHAAAQADALEEQDRRADLAAYLKENRQEFNEFLADETNCQDANHTLRSIIKRILLYQGPALKIEFR